MSLRSAAAVFGLAALATAASALPALAVTGFASTDVNIRTCGSTDCDIVDVLHEGEEVTIDYCQYQWCAIQRRGPDGWVNANYLLPGEEDGVDEFDDFDDYDEDYYDDRYDDDGIYIAPRRFHRRFVRRVDPFVIGACVGGPDARFCVYD